MCFRPAQINKTKCPKCGFENKPIAKVCEKCGAPLDGGSAGAAAPGMPAAPAAPGAPKAPAAPGAPQPPAK